MNHSGDTNKMVDTPRTDAAYAASTGAGIYELFKESQDIERELAAAKQRIKRLEQAGDAMALVLFWSSGTQYKRSPTASAWRKAREVKP